MDPPTCCPTLTMAEATPASARSTPAVAVLMDAEMVRPRPAPKTSVAGRTRLAWSLVTLIRASRNAPIAARNSPGAIVQRGPTLVSSTRVPSCAEIARTTVIGRKARPAWTAVNARLC